MFAVPVTVSGTSLPLTRPVATPLALMPFAHVAENSPLSALSDCPVIFHWKFEQPLAISPTGCEFHVPTSDASAAASDGAMTLELDSKPAQALANRASSSTEAE